jgi:pimeloyl-ACP methyl ester carboxylesterase
MRRPLDLPTRITRTTPFAARARALASSLAVAVAVAACADTMPTGPDPVVADRSVMTVPATGIWAEVRRGTTGEGALYELFVPQGWNGDVVFYAHGVRDVLEPVDLKDQDRSNAIREELGRLGFAVAASSYSENGYVVKDGAQRTHQLRGLFASQFGQPERSFVMGHSLGGLIAMSLVERFPSQYDGALPVCAVLGGSRPQVDYITNVRALFDVFYPGVLSGTAGEIPEGYIITPADQNRIIGAVMANPAGLAVIASTAQTPLEFSFGANTQVEMVTSLIYALRYHARGVDNVLPLVNGKLPFDIAATVYSARAGFPALVPPPMLAGALAAVNENVGRWEGDPSAEQYMERWFTPSGRLEVPVVTLHNRWDPLVPYFHEGLFREAVIAAGSASLLEQRTIDRYGHCNIEAAEVIDAFQALVAKAEARAAVAN